MPTSQKSLGPIPASSDTVASEARQMKYAVLDNVRKKEKKTYVNLIMLESGVKVVNYCVFGERLQVDKVRHPHRL